MDFQPNADFLKDNNATHYVIVHNHPSGDPSPSHADVENTSSMAKIMKELIPEANFLAHYVINHRTYSKLDFNGKHEFGNLEENSAPDPYPFLPNQEIGDRLDKYENIVNLARHMQDRKEDPNIITGFLLNSREQVVAVLQGNEEDFMSASVKDWQDYARSQSGTRLIAHMKVDSEIEAQQTMKRFKPMNTNNILTDMFIEHEIGMEKGITHKLFGGNTPQFFEHSKHIPTIKINYPKK